jgi:predicted RNA-binding Zn-ribbon protein involved in translation (DUF1610 family)
MSEIKGKIIRAAPPDYKTKRKGAEWAISGNDIIRCPNCNEVITAADHVSPKEPKEYQCLNCGAVSRFPA